MGGYRGIQGSLEGYGMQFVATLHIAMLVRVGGEQAGQQAVPARKERGEHPPKLAFRRPEYGCQQETAKGLLGIGEAESASSHPLQGQGKIARVSRRLFQGL